ncbi:hypothetical protein [Streptacidiphilus sp. P02-A3a]|uniref:hypothetical protein n=1 Tax=Streptacidiphilus sp. P02-A3a TaxID=2704468 RepID=UPI0015FDADC0|nr:hypothetical protein [Streptacidiphilus sp. P02-A3a]QMU66969.1 hypothetical protein GXP74_00785 [Streptacidiphilus sp. P02-A3a]
MDHNISGAAAECRRAVSRNIAETCNHYEALPAKERWGALSSLCREMDRLLAPFLIRTAGELSEECGGLPSRPDLLRRALGLG